MATLENVKLLEAKVAKVVEKVKQLTGANTALMEENKQLKKKIDTFQNQINELEFSILTYKEDHQTIESGILSALNRLNQVEDSLENKSADVEQHTDAALAPVAQREQPVQNYPAHAASFKNGDMIHDQGYPGNNVHYHS
ncbi:MAG: cell division protein ZapB [Treponema sp.]|jgi:TolA-binding protein|nr:cell division protein ZapB [Treponema sp.]